MRYRLNLFRGRDCIGRGDLVIDEKAIDMSRLFPGVMESNAEAQANVIAFNIEHDVNASGHVRLHVEVADD